MPAKVLCSLTHTPTPFSQALSGLPQAALCLEVNVYLTTQEPLPHLCLMLRNALPIYKPTKN